MKDHPTPVSLSRRFYKTVAVIGEEPFAIHLDGRPLRTPMKASLALPTRALAEAIADEWQAQDKIIDPCTMPLTKLANTAIDRVASQRERIIDEITAFAGSDLVCYRAHEPQGLIVRQSQYWDPVLAWAKRELDARFILALGVMFVEQPAEALAATHGHMSAKSDAELAAIHNMTTLTGSALLAAMVAEKVMTGEEAWRAAHVDEDWQIEHWGEDTEASRRRLIRKAEFDSCCRWLDLQRT